MRKFTSLAILLTSTCLISPATAETVNTYEKLQEALSVSDANVVLDMNGQGIDLNGATGTTVTGDQSVTFQNIDSWTGTSQNVINKGTAAFNNVVFENNDALLSGGPAGGGGNIKNDGGHITEINNVKFDKNNSVSPETLWGGVIDNIQGGVIDVIKDSSFTDNYAYSGGDLAGAAPHGGVIYNGSSYGSNVGGTIKLIDNVVFENNVMTSKENNTGGAHGVAIDNNVYGVIEKITNSKFINNRTYRTGTEEKDPSLNYHASGGAMDNYNIIGEISDTLFQGNSAEAESVSASATSGAIMNLYSGGEEKGAQGRIEKIVNVQFIDNYAQNLNGTANAGGVTNGSGVEGGIGYIGKMENVLFQGNYAKGGRNESGYIGAYGGALLNSGYIGSISGKFINNYAENTKEVSGAQGGAIFNAGENAEIPMIQADFEGNYLKAVNGSVSGGAITNRSNATIDKIEGNFKENYVVSQAGASNGGAIINNSSSINEIKGNFTDNYAQNTEGSAGGGAINNNSNGIINKIAGNFDGNSAKTVSKNASGGAIINWGTIEELKGDFTNNYAQSTDGNAVGGGFVNNYGNENSTFGTLQGNFENNKAISENGYAQGGAIYNKSTLENILNSSFINNSVEGNEESKGGAIYSAKDLTITADNGSSLFQGNTVNGESNAIYMDGTEDTPLSLNLTAKNSGTITFDDAIDGQYYDININGDENSNITFNNALTGVSNMNLANNSVLTLGINSNIEVENLHQAQATATSISTKAISSGSSTINVDIEVDKANNTVKSGVINVAGDISGNYKVILNSLNPETFDGASVVFLNAPNDTTDDTTMEIARVMGSPYLWDISVDDNQGFSWSVSINDKLNPNYDGRMTAPEVVASIGLHSAAIEQTRSVVRNVANKAANARSYCPGCGVVTEAWNGKKLHNVWLLAQGENANIDKPVDMEAKIWGIEAGFDMQNNINHSLGAFVSYRDGEYDLSGKGSKKHSTIGSDIEIDSYLAGLYYRYDKNMNWLFATAYVGKQEAKASTDDNIADFETDGLEFGASVEAGHTFALTDTLTLDPSMGVYYTQVNFDDASDNVGKKYEWDDIKHLEIEAGLKLEKNFEYSKVYIKPSVVQTITEDDSVSVTGLKDVKTYHDQTLGRIEIGGRLGITDSLYSYGWINYTFGSSYDATALGLGLNYTW